MATADLYFTEDEMSIDGAVGYPTAYAKICRDRGFGPYSHGPPFTYTPYALQPQEATRAKELDNLFPVIDPKAKPTAKAKIFTSLLWKQLNHLGNAGFDPAKFRVDPYGNVLYYHADAASPLAWDIDHWFPCSRGGLTVPSNLRILQWQVCKKKHNKLEFLIPWWDLQVGISINQFLSIFASSNSDFRHRAFSLLFADGESEELNDSQTVDSHSFPQHFVESKKQLGLAPAAVVVSRRESFDALSTLKSLDINRRLRSNSPVIAARKLRTGMSKENENPDIVNNPYQAIVLARDSLRQKEETTKMQTDIQKLDDEVNELKQKTDEERVAIQDMELVLIKRRRRAEKCRRLAEAQSSYRAMLEKMIRDAMHQSVVYKEQVRLNQAASNALMARLEAQKAISDSSERELHKKFKQRDELEKQIRPEWEQARKRSRMDETFYGERDEKTILYLPGSKPIAHLEKKTEEALQGDEDEDENNALDLPGIDSIHKELRVFLEEEHKASEAGSSLNGEGREPRLQKRQQAAVDDICKVKHEESDKPIVVLAEDENIIKDRLQKLRIGEGMPFNTQFPAHEPAGEEDDESRQKRGKGNVEKWLQMLLEGTDQDAQIAEGNVGKTDEIIRKLNLKYPQKEIKILRFPESPYAEGMEERASEDNCKHSIQKKNAANEEEEIVEIEDLEKYGGEKNKEASEIEARKIHLKDPPYRLSSAKSSANEMDCVDKVVGSRSEKGGKVLKRSESARSFRRIPSSPSMILGMRKGVDCMGKKPLVIGDDEGVQNEVTNNFFKSSIKTIKRAVKM